MWPASFLVLALSHAAYAENYITVYEGHSKDSQPSPGQLTGVPVYDRLLSRLPGTGRITGQHLLDGPMFIQMPRQDGRIANWFADEGLSSVLSEPLMAPVRDFLLTTEKARALVYRLATYQDPRLLGINVSEAFIPDDFQIGDFLAMLVRNPQIPVFLVSDEEYFKKLNLDDADVKYIGKLSLSVDSRAKFIQG